MEALHMQGNPDQDVQEHPIDLHADHDQGKHAPAPKGQKHSAELELVSTGRFDLGGYGILVERAECYSETNGRGFEDSVW